MVGKSSCCVSRTAWVQIPSMTHTHIHSKSVWLLVLMTSLRGWMGSGKIRRILWWKFADCQPSKTVKGRWGSGSVRDTVYVESNRGDLMTSTYGRDTLLYICLMHTDTHITNTHTNTSTLTHWTKLKRALIGSNAVECHWPVETMPSYRVLRRLS